MLMMQRSLMLQRIQRPPPWPLRRFTVVSRKSMTQWTLWTTLISSWSKSGIHQWLRGALTTMGTRSFTRKSMSTVAVRRPLALRSLTTIIFLRHPSATTMRIPWKPNLPSLKSKTWWFHPSYLWEGKRGSRFFWPSTHATRVSPRTRDLTTSSTSSQMRRSASPRKSSKETSKIV